MKRDNRLDTREITVFAMLGTIMFATKLAMETIPSIHLLGLFIVATTVVYRTKALFPLYTYVFLDGIRWGFSLSWIPYLYIWTILWGIVMLLPKNMSPKIAVPVYMVVAALHGLSFGILYAPMQMLLFNYSLHQIPLWIASGFYFDLLHCQGNFLATSLALPLIHVLKETEKRLKR